MLYLRAAIATISVLVVSLLGFILYTYDEKYELRNAQEYFLKGEYSQAEAILNRLEGLLPDSQYNLYQAYVARAQMILPSQTPF